MSNLNILFKINILLMIIIILLNIFLIQKKYSIVECFE